MAAGSKKKAGGDLTRRTAATQRQRDDAKEQQRTAAANAQRQATAGGSPAAATTDASAEEERTQARLEQQRTAAAERTEAAAARRPEGEMPTSGVFTAVSRNGLSHRRNGILFGAEPTCVDISGWSEDQKQRFFNDGVLMIVPGQQVNARGATLAPAMAFPVQLAGGNAENATPAMLKAMERGAVMAHPASGAANPVVGVSYPRGAQQLEELINTGDDTGAGDDGGES